MAVRLKRQLQHFQTPLSKGSSPSVSGGPLCPGAFSQEEAGNHPWAPVLPPQLPLPFPPPAFRKGQEAGADAQKPSTAFLGGGGGQGSEGRWQSVPPLSDGRAGGCGKLNQVPATLLPSQPGPRLSAGLSDLFPCVRRQSMISHILGLSRVPRKLGHKEHDICLPSLRIILSLLFLFHRALPWGPGPLETALTGSLTAPDWAPCPSELGILSGRPGL